jgi:hypothetical protein
MSSPLDPTGLPGFDNTVPLDIDQGPPPPLNLDPFGPNPWAGGGASPVNVPATGTVKDLGRSPGIALGTVLLLAILFL